ncbi:MAG TPA: helix-turn-helix transcriptional regulator [Allosphingosinicella sp.]|jgi:DNA-binding CsgD family transcriptional regulator
MGSDPIAQLSPRQRDCLRLVAELKDSQQIGYELGISPRTVDGYLADAVRLLGAHNRRHAAGLLRDYDASAPPEYTPPEKLRAHFPRLEPGPAAERAMEVQFSEGVSEEKTINAVRDVPRAFLTETGAPSRPSRLLLLAGDRQPGDLRPMVRLALIVGTSLASGLGFFILALAAVGLIAWAGYLRP